MDRRSALMVAAEPVLAELAHQLDGASYCVVLADRQSRIVECTAGSEQLCARLAGLGVVRGGVFREETTGTNSIATAHELRQGIASAVRSTISKHSNRSAAMASRSSIRPLAASTASSTSRAWPETNHLC
ncbi:hypothetical protein AB0H34_24110 [Saccharopolyspora shandongensis]|uniref:hypothetical protein n=1 Tax=Saccharopolyspora shandongensis TaxID=418495 RepID=UPI0033DF2FD7